MADTISVSMGIPRNAPLRYGDSVAILPDGVNGLISYGGAHDGRPWVEILCDGAPVRALQSAASTLRHTDWQTKCDGREQSGNCANVDMGEPCGTCASLRPDPASLFLTVLEFFEQVPPNMRDCHFRIKPRSHYGEARSTI